MTPSESEVSASSLRSRLPSSGRAPPAAGGTRGATAATPIEFDVLTVCLFEAVRGPRPLSHIEVEATQNAHLEFLASLHEQGVLQAAGPFEDPVLPTVRGMSIHRLAPGAVRELMASDPWVEAGYVTVRVFSWKVPRGAIAFRQSRFPRSRDET